MQFFRCNLAANFVVTNSEEFLSSACSPGIQLFNLLKKRVFCTGISSTLIAYRLAFLGGSTILVCSYSVNSCCV